MVIGHELKSIMTAMRKSKSRILVSLGNSGTVRAVGVSEQESKSEHVWCVCLG